MTPKHLLLASDLTCRGDRAMDRAAALALDWGAALTVIHVLTGVEATAPDEPSWRRPPSRREVVERRIRRDLGGAEGLRLDVVVERGDPAQLVLETAQQRGCDLVVTGTPREETLARAVLGTTLEGLARRSTAPVLVVKARPRHPYRRVVVATDFSEGSRRAFELGLALFPRAEVTLFHAHDVPFESRAADQLARREEAEERSRRDSREFLDQTPAAAGVEVQVVTERGDPARALTRFVEEREIELVVVGSHGRSRLAHLLLGSVAHRVAMEVPTDVLLARGQPPSDPRSP